MSALPPIKPVVSSVNKKLAATIDKVKQKHNLPITGAASAIVAKQTTIATVSNNNPKNTIPDVVKPKPTSVAIPKKLPTKKSILEVEEEELPVLSYVGREVLDRDIMDELASDAESDDQDEDEDKVSDVEEADIVDDRVEELDDAKAAALLEAESRRIEERRRKNPPNQFLESLMAKYCTFDELEGQGFERKIPEKFRFSATEKARIEQEEAARKALEGGNESSSEYDEDEEEEDEESSEEEEEKEIVKPQPKTNVSVPTKPGNSNIVATKQQLPKVAVAAKPEQKQKSEPTVRRSNRATKYQGPWKMTDDLPDTDESDSDFVSDDDDDDSESEEESEDSECDSESEEEYKKPQAKTVKSSNAQKAPMVAMSSGVSNTADSLKRKPPNVNEATQEMKKLKLTKQ